MTTVEIIQLMNKRDVQSQLQGIKEADKAMNSRVYEALRNLSMDYQVGDIVKVEAKKILKKYDPDQLEEESRVISVKATQEEEEEKTEIKFTDKEEETKKDKSSGPSAVSKLLPILKIGVIVLIVLGILGGGGWYAINYKPMTTLSKARDAYAAEEWAEAQKLYEELLNVKTPGGYIRDNYEEILLGAAECAEMAQDFGAAQKHYKLLSREYPDVVEYQYKIAVLLEYSNINAAIEMYKKIMDSGDETYAERAREKFMKLSSATSDVSF